MNYKICIALQITTDDFELNKNLLENAVNANPDFIELRLDYLKDPEKITQDFIEKLIEISKSKIPVIFTLRSRKEGGQMNVIEEDRLTLIKMIIKEKPQVLDVEFYLNEDSLNEIINLAEQYKVKLIFSYHDFIKTPDFDNCKEIIEDFLKKLNNFNEKFHIIKTIFTAKNFEDNLIALDICKYFSEKDFKIICFCMGEIGIFSRVTCVKAGSYFTFASLKEATAPGQINIKKMRKLHHLLFDK
ncbi:MAG: type I 3-dehydroquinate dehydratase [Promethearchaeota archaeon]